MTSNDPSVYQLDEPAFTAAIQGTALHPFASEIIRSVSEQGHGLKHGHLPDWQAAIEQLPDSPGSAWGVRDGAIDIQLDSQAIHQHRLSSSLRQLMPWRKGPYRFGPVFVDTEWRSDWKWNRLQPHIASLAGKCVLDVGCGSGYHLWRMRNSGAMFVLGIDPSLLYVKQFEAVQHFIQDAAVQLLPLPLHALPAPLHAFDTVFSMGVLYHRQDPLQHLTELKQALMPLGELVLETLIMPGDNNDALRLDGRYANMRNIYELPTSLRLCSWLHQAGFCQVRVVDVTRTSRQEQRSTEWMTSHSLAQALSSHDDSLTVEGHPRPLRAIVVASVGAPSVDQA